MSETPPTAVPSTKEHESPEGTIFDGKTAEDAALEKPNSDIEKGKSPASGPPDGGLAAWTAIIGVSTYFSTKVGP